MAQPQILVSLGKEKYTVPHDAGMTFGQLRERVAEQSGQDAASFRFICKGRSVKDNEAVATGDPPAILKVMALRSQKYHKQQGNAVKKPASSSAGLTSALEDASKQEQRKVNIATVRPAAPRGDTVAPDAHFVVVRVGRDRYNVCVEATRSVRDVKERLSNMDGIVVRAADINLIFSGRQCRDDDTLGGLGVKRGSMMLMLAKARHHDANDAKVDLGKIKDAASRLEKQAGVLVRQFERRLTDMEGIRARLGEAEGEAAVLRDQLRNNRCEDDGRKDVEDCLRMAEEKMEALRERMA